MNRRISLASAVLLTTAASLIGQDDDELIELESYIVDGVPVEELIVPTARSFDSVYGMSRSVLDTPRNITIISREQLDAIAIDSVRDFTKLTSSSYTRTNFGAPSNPDIRTQIADMMWNGMRKGLTSNGNGMPLNFNSVESVNIVKGPASVVHGASMYVGGYADLITKRPYFDTFRGEASVTIGSYDKKSWTLDFGGPLSENLAYRVSYNGEDSDSFYDNSWIHSQALYGAVTYRPNDTYELFVNAEIVYANYTENFGINRPTQALIDRGEYITGINNNPSPDADGLYFDSNGNAIGFGNPGVPAGDPAPISDAQNSRWVVTGFPVTNRMDFDFDNPVPVDRSWRLSKPGDDSEGVNWTLQAIQSWAISPDSKLVNNTLGHYIERDTLSSYMYTEIIDPSYRFENRTEYQYMGEDFDANVGFSLTYQRVKAYNHFFWEPANVWDLTKDTEFIDVYNSVNFPDTAEVPGWPNRYATAGIFNGDTNNSKAYGFGPFAQVDWRLGDFGLLAGVRLDYLDVDYSDPIAPLLGFPVASVTDSINVTNINYNISPTYKLRDNISLYATCNFSENPGGAVANGGGFGQPEDGDGDGQYTLSKNRFQQESELLEAGVKTSLMDNQLFIGAAIFEQTRSNLQLDGSIEEFTTEGFEVEGNYQPNRNFFMTLAMSILDSTVNGPSFDVNNTSPFLPDQVPNFFLPAVDADGNAIEYRRQGVPKTTINGLLSYKWDNGFGVQVAGYYTTEINNNVAGSLVIPDQYNIDLTFVYTAEDWEIRLAILNVTDEENWAAPNAVYGGESIFAEQPIRAELTGTWKF